MVISDPVSCIPGWEVPSSFPGSPSCRSWAYCLSLSLEMKNEGVMKVDKMIGLRSCFEPFWKNDGFYCLYENRVEILCRKCRVFPMYRHCSKNFLLTHLIITIPYEIGIIIFPRKGSWITEKLSHLPKDTQLVKGRVWIQIQDKQKTQINGIES